MIDAVVVATKNPDKVAELDALFARWLPEMEVVAGASWPDVDETGETLEENALLKARTACAVTGHVAVADDTGLEVDALGGSPGVHTARFAGPNATYAENRAALLEALRDTDDRSARFRTVVAMVTPGGTEITAEGQLEGRIARSERGSGGFGYDPIFELDSGLTLAEVGEAEKNETSHRHSVWG